MNDPRPIIGITMGDPAGIGPEITARALLRAELFERCRPVVIGDAGVMRQAVKIARAPLTVKVLERCADASGTPGTMDVLDLHNVDVAQLQLGKVSAAAGDAAFKSIVRSIELAMDGQIAGVVTNPIHKEALHQAGHNFPGHTEIFAHYTGSKESVMMLAHGPFRVAHVSTHVSLRQACDRVTRERVLRVIELAAQGCRDLGIEDPRVGVAGLNPHAGENGLFGDEEMKAIAPAIREANARGIHCTGPFAADTFFPRVAGGAGREFDIAIAMYHDQGHIAVKMKGFQFDGATGKWTAVNGINVSLGLPIVRVSVDHGTAFDQAGTGTASEASLLDALDYGIRMGVQRHKKQAAV